MNHPTGYSTTGRSGLGTVHSDTATPHDMEDALRTVRGDDRMPGPGMSGPNGWTSAPSWVETSLADCERVAEILRSQGHDVRVTPTFP